MLIAGVLLDTLNAALDRQTPVDPNWANLEERKAA